MYYEVGTSLVRTVDQTRARKEKEVSNCCSGNLVLQNTIERLYAGNLYAEIPRGIFLVRGENVLLLGEIVWTGPSQPAFGLLAYLPR